MVLAVLFSGNNFFATISWLQHCSGVDARDHRLELMGVLVVLYGKKYALWSN